MGITAGFFSGSALTLLTLSLTLTAHQQIRARQRSALQLETEVLNRIALQQPLEAPLQAPTRRLVSAGFVAACRDRWNAEVRGLAGRLLGVDWDGIIRGGEEGVVEGVRWVRGKVGGQ